MNCLGVRGIMWKYIKSSVLGIDFMNKSGQRDGKEGKPACATSAQPPGQTSASSTSESQGDAGAAMVPASEQLVGNADMHVPSSEFEVHAVLAWLGPRLSHDLIRCGSSHFAF